MKKTLLYVLLLLVTHLNGQVLDNFEDGDFTSNPQWVGNQNKFIVNSSNQLKLDDDETNISYLVTNNLLINDVEWRFWLKFSFSPSSNNNIRYYLVSNNNNLQASLDGYFLQIGESGSSDAIELFKQEGTEITSICRGTEGSISSSSEIRVKVTRNDSGNWKIFVDSSGGEEFLLETEGDDNTFSQTSAIGFICKYTSSNSKKIYFDDIYVGPQIIDTTPPEITNCSALNDSIVALKFSEVLSAGSVINTDNYIVDNNIGNPVSAIEDEVDASLIVLTFSNKFVSGKQYSISVSGLLDLSDNIMNPAQVQFSYYKSKPNDIIINEIMVDPTPPVNLPEYEYIELYNKTKSNIDISGWSLIIGSSEKEFSSVTVNAESYLIVAKESAHVDFLKYGDCYGFSSFSLTNSGQTLLLKSDDGEMISQVSYEDSWYNDVSKENGGWSIELINSNNNCSGGENWKASTDIRGGTPGSVNSIINENIFRPQITKLEVTGNNSLHVQFNQNMNEESLWNRTLYYVDDVGNPESVNIFPDDFKKAELLFAESFTRGLSYSISISSEMMNCNMLNMFKDTSILFGLPDSASFSDIVINEILFNPWTNGEDYLELFNRSNKIIDLSTMKVGSIKHNPPNPPDTSIYNIVIDQRLILPNDYVLITKSKDAVLQQYSTLNPGAFIDVNPMPSFNNDQGNVLLLLGENIIIDSFSYSENMHFPLLLYLDGVALEKINPHSNPSKDNDWHSAAESVGFGTPGYANSQLITTSDVEEEIVINPEIFTPDNDGIDDVLSIEYSFSSPGYIMSVTIYNSDGLQVKKLTDNEYVGADGSISWDGFMDSNSKALVGIYVFYITVYDTQGNVKSFKKSGVLATDFR
jgi:lamin tail-like protein/CHU domain-containing protein/Big-like domain-containing protein